MTTLKSLMMVGALLVGGASLAVAQNVSGYFVVRLNLRSMKPFAQQLGIISGRQF
jgi:hypothetical protein